MNINIINDGDYKECIELSGREIYDLALFAGFKILPDGIDDLLLSAELTIMTCPDSGIKNEYSDKKELYRMIAFFSDIPQEGSIGLGNIIE